ncbi:MAG: AEC family transporter [Peptostreptococcus porci]|nr:AEC family transporter [Peptostreptococcus porci]
MDNFIFALNATIPVFLVIVLGNIMMKKGIITKEWTKISDRLAFRIALPITLFMDIVSMKSENHSNIKFVVFCALTTSVIFLISWIMSNIFVKDKYMVGAFAQGSVRGSAAILGMPFVINIYGNSGLVPLMILAAVPLFNAYSVIMLTVSAAKNRNSKKRINYMAIIKSIFTNPLIIGILLGFPFYLLKIEFPQLISKSLNTIGAISVPLMLISIGGDFKFDDIFKKFRPSLVATFIKLILLPAIVLPIAIYFGFRESALLAILIMVGAPSAMTGYIMAKNMDNDYVLMSNIVVMTTLLSSITFTFWLFLLKTLNLL